MQTTRVFNNGRSQAVRIPKNFRFDVEEVFVNKIGDTLMLTPVSKLGETFDKGAAILTDDFLADDIPEEIPVAMHARALGSILVTNNTREFSRVEGLSIEDWK